MMDNFSHTDMSDLLKDETIYNRDTEALLKQPVRILVDMNICFYQRVIFPYIK